MDGNSDSGREYTRSGDELRNEFIAWDKSINDDDEYGLHRLVCSSMDPSKDEIYQLNCEHTMVQKNSIVITPLEYLAANTYANVDEKKLMKRFVL